MDTCDAAVIGAGIAGAACAYELATSGLRVVVVDAATDANETQLGYGAIRTAFENPAQFELAQYGLQLWEDLAEYLPKDCEYLRSGRIWIAEGAEELKRLTEHTQFLKARGVAAELLDADSLAELEPALRPGLTGGLLVKQDAWLNGWRAAEFLMRLAERAGAKRLRQNARKLGQNEAMLDNGSTLYAGNTINAAGAGANLLMAELKLERSKGHVLTVETEARLAGRQLAVFPKCKTQEIQLELRQSGRERHGGSTVWLGSSYQQTFSDADAEKGTVAALLRQAIELIPTIGSARPLQSWAAVRVTTEDGLPLIGRVGGGGGMFVTAGHGSNGIAGALASAKLIADEILSRNSEIDPKPYRVDRFTRGGQNAR